MHDLDPLYVGCDVLRRRDLHAPDVEHIHALLWCDSEELEEAFETLGQSAPALADPPEEFRSLFPEGTAFLGHFRAIHVRIRLEPDNPYGDHISTIQDLAWVADTAGQVYADLISAIEDHIDQIGDLAAGVEITGITLSLRENFLLVPWLDPTQALRRVIEEVAGYPVSGCKLSVHAATELPGGSVAPIDDTGAIDLQPVFWESVPMGTENWLLRFSVSLNDLREDAVLPLRAGIAEGAPTSPHAACEWAGEVE